MLRLIELQKTSILKQLELEEQLLRSHSDSFLLINHNASPAFVLGISGKQHEWIHPNPPYPVIKRYTGGGCVVIDESTLFITLIGSSRLLKETLSPPSLHRFMSPFYEPLGLSLKENDYCIGPHKVGGNAQYLTKDRFVHHTSFLWDFDPKNMALLKHPPRSPNYRQNRPHETFLTRLKSHHPSLSDFINKIKFEFSKTYIFENFNTDNIVFNSRISSCLL